MRWFRCHRRHRHHRLRQIAIVAFVHHHGKIHMSTAANVGQNILFAIQQFDTAGVPMPTPDAYDSSPVWSNTNPAAETITAAPDGLTATGSVIGAGDDTVTVTVIVGGVSFTASESVVASAVVPKLGSIGIVATVS